MIWFAIKNRLPEIGEACLYFFIKLLDDHFMCNGFGAAGYAVKIYTRSK
jgi:hypothetical protein